MKTIDWTILGAAVLGLTGCGDDFDGEQDDVGRVELAIANAPTDVHCLVVTAESSARTLQRPIDISAGSAVTVTLDGLPTGTVALGASVYSETCTALTGKSVPTWLSDPDKFSVVLTAGTPMKWDLVLRPNGILNARVDWLDDTANSPFVPVSLAAGDFVTCARPTAGLIRCWGAEANRPVGTDSGTGTHPNSPVPVAMDGTSNAVVMAVGGNHGCAITGDGSMKCWRGIAYQEFWVDRMLVTIPGVSNAISIAAGPDHNCAVLSDNTVRCWGSNLQGQLGDGTTLDSVQPVAVPGVSDALAVAAGLCHACALRRDGSVQCWGCNEHGQLGDGTTVSSPLPVSSSGVGNAVAIAAGGTHTCAVLSDGTIRCWGGNESGELGIGTRTESNTLPAVVSTISGALAVACGQHHSCALLTNGTMQCWGYNDWGQLGSGTTVTSAVPVSVSGISGAKAMACGGYHTCAILNDDSMRCWGHNSEGQLGNGTTSYSAQPVEVLGSP